MRSVPTVGIACPSGAGVGVVLAAGTRGSPHRGQRGHRRARECHQTAPPHLPAVLRLCAAAAGEEVPRWGEFHHTTAKIWPDHREAQGLPVGEERPFASSHLRGKRTYHKN